MSLQANRLRVLRFGWRVDGSELEKPRQSDYSTHVPRSALEEMRSLLRPSFLSE